MPAPGFAAGKSIVPIITGRGCSGPGSSGPALPAHRRLKNVATAQAAALEGVKAVKERILADKGHPEWEVINAGNPTSNSYQHRLLWEQELSRTRPDILLIEIGGNDVSQAWMMDSRWKPGTTWPWRFIMALEGSARKDRSDD